MHFRIFLLLSTNAARFCPFTVVRRITPAGTCTFIFGKYEFVGDHGVLQAFLASMTDGESGHQPLPLYLLEHAATLFSTGARFVGVMLTHLHTSAGVLNVLPYLHIEYIQQFVHGPSMFFFNIWHILVSTAAIFQENCFTAWKECGHFSTAKSPF